MEPFLKRNVNSLGQRTNYTLNPKAEGKFSRPRRCKIASTVGMMAWKKWKILVWNRLIHNHALIWEEG